MILAYFIFGVGLYIGMSLNNPKSFIDASAAELIRGILLFIVFWPIGIVIAIVRIMQGEL